MKPDSKIFVAGHKGLVGSAIVNELLAKGYKNLVLKDRRDLDLRNQKACSDFFKSEKPEYVFLAAAKVGGIIANNKYRGEFIYDNLMIQSNVIHHSYKNDVKKLLFLGSTCIYPREADQPMREDSLLTSPLEYTNEPYAIAKIAGIKMCESYNQQYGTNFLSVMPTNLYGPNDNFDLEKSHVLPALIRKVHLGKMLENGDYEGIVQDFISWPLEGKKLSADRKEEIIDFLSGYGIQRDANSNVSVEIWGSGLPRREFLWSEELAGACVFIMEEISFSDVVGLGDKSSLHNAESPGKREIRNAHLNIGTGKDISISELASLIKKTIGFKGEFVFNSSKPDGTMRKLTEVSRLHSLGWKHKIEIEEGIRILYEWYIKSFNV